MKSKEEISKELFDLIFCQAISYNTEKETKDFLCSLSYFNINYGIEGKTEFVGQLTNLFSKLEDKGTFNLSNDRVLLLKEVREQVASLIGIKTD